MEPASKPGTVRGLLARLLLFGVAALLLRLAYVVTVHGGTYSCASSGDFCLFSSPESLSTLPGGTTTASFVRVADGSATITPALRALWTSREWRKAVDFYSATFQDLVAEGFLSRTSKTLCVDAAAGHEVLALKELGVADSIGIARKKSPPLVISADLSRQPFKNDTFDFVFSGRGGIERSSRSTELAEEIVRTLRPEGFLAIHTFSAGDQYSLRALLDLFPSFRMVRSREIGGPDSTLIREIVLQKKGGSEIFSSKIKELGGISVNKCPVPEHKLRLLKSAEPLIKEEPLKPWITLKRNIKNVKYLPSMADISFKRRYIYIDVGARSYGSSIGSWFKKQYPKQNHTFDIYAIEADPAFHKEYAMKKRVNLMPYAAWVRNETLSFEVNHDPDQKEVEKGQGMGRIWTSGAFSGGLASGDVHKIKGFDFAEWLKTMVTERDFVVMKMDVEGTEFDLVPRLFETGAICLIDELFLECHYNRWQRCCPGERSPKYKKTYGQCLGLLTSLRESGVLVHQWW